MTSSQEPTSKLLHSYINGNVSVQLFEDGSKIREYDGEPAPVFPESMDVKITNYCDAGCTYCHEMSTLSGQHANLEDGLVLFGDLPPGVELALGGGNPLSHNGLSQFLEQSASRGLVCNLTVNAFHIRKSMDQLKEYLDKKWLHGLGISYNPALLDSCVMGAKLTQNAVFHIILGVHTPKDVKRLLWAYPGAKILFLGYKHYGRGKTYHTSRVDECLYRWNVEVHEMLHQNKSILSFDNLAIEQLKLRRFFADNDMWKLFYMGDDGLFTMYVDLVKLEYARSSISTLRFGIADVNTTTTASMFDKVRRKQ